MSLKPGDKVTFHYLPEQWSWLPASRGRLGNYVPGWLLELAHEQVAEVRYTHGGHLSSYYFGEDEDWVFLRFKKPLGLSCYAPPSSRGISEFAAPISALKPLRD